MNQFIFNVVVFSWYVDHYSSKSVVLSSLSEEKAMAFAKSHYQVNHALATLNEREITVEVYSCQIGVPETEQLLWASNELRSTDEALATLDLASSLIIKFNKPPVEKLFYKTLLQPTLGWAIGNTDLQVTPSHIESFLAPAIERYSWEVSQVKDETLAELAIAKLGTEFSSMGVSTPLNQNDWAIFNEFESQYH